MEDINSKNENMGIENNIRKAKTTIILNCRLIFKNAKEAHFPTTSTGLPSIAI